MCTGDAAEHSMHVDEDPVDIPKKSALKLPKTRADFDKLHNTKNRKREDRGAEVRTISDTVLHSATSRVLYAALNARLC